MNTEQPQPFYAFCKVKKCDSVVEDTHPWCTHDRSSSRDGRKVSHGLHVRPLRHRLALFGKFAQKFELIAVKGGREGGKNLASSSNGLEKV